jgi:hypothetical protein
VTPVLIGNIVVLILGVFTVEALLLAFSYHCVLRAIRGNPDEATRLFRKAVRVHRSAWPLNRLRKERREFALMCAQARIPTP